MQDPTQSSSNLTSPDSPTVLVLGNNTFNSTYWDSAPGNWGTPWEHIQPSIQFNGDLVRKTPDDSHRWFRAQAIRYLMRYPSPLPVPSHQPGAPCLVWEGGRPRCCGVHARGRHDAGTRTHRHSESAGGMPSVVPTSCPEVTLFREALAPIWACPRGKGHTRAQQGQTVCLSPLAQVSDMSDWGETPWPLLGPCGALPGEGQSVGMHVRQGDKGGEMIIHPFSDHMDLASRIRLRSPTARSIWLITEMEVGPVLLVSLVCPCVCRWCTKNVCPAASAWASQLRAASGLSPRWRKVNPCCAPCRCDWTPGALLVDQECVPLVHPPALPHRDASGLIPPVPRWRCAVLCGCVQTVVEEARNQYKPWKFYYTDVPRQGSNRREFPISYLPKSLASGPSWRTHWSMQ